MKNKHDTMMESNTSSRRPSMPLLQCGCTAVGRMTGTPRAISVTFIVAVVVLLVTPNFVSGSAKGSLFIPRDTTPKSISISLSSLFDGHRIPRGGGIGYGRKKGGKGSIYLQALDDEIVWLEQQVRRVEQEKRSLQKKMTKRQHIRNDLLESKSEIKAKAKAQAKDNRRKDKNALDQQDEDLLRLANLEQLEKQIQSLLTAKSQLESIQLDYDQKLQALQLDLSRSTSRKNDLEKTFLTRVKELETSLQKVREAAAHFNSNFDVRSDPDLSRRIDEACRAAIAEFWVEGNRKLQEHERQLKARHVQDLLEERRLASLAVDRQRQKMRALARATAIREKEISAKAKELSRRLLAQSKSQSQPQPKPTGMAHQTTNPKPKTPADRKKDEKLERETLKAIREEAERKAREEEERMWLELECELELERERLQRLKQREEEERIRCEQEELERRRLLRQHALDTEERLRQEQAKAAANEFGFGGSGKKGPSLFWKLLGSRKKLKKDKTPPTYLSDPSIASIESYQRRVMWQPVSLPPKEVVRITGPSKSD